MTVKLSSGIFRFMVFRGEKNLKNSTMVVSGVLRLGKRCVIEGDKSQCDLFCLVQSNSQMLWCLIV